MKAFEFVEVNGVPFTREEAVFQALGAASMCWQYPEKAGIFDSTRAQEIGNKLLAVLRGADASPEG